MFNSNFGLHIQYVVNTFSRRCVSMLCYCIFEKCKAGRFIINTQCFSSFLIRYQMQKQIAWVHLFYVTRKGLVKGTLEVWVSFATTHQSPFTAASLGFLKVEENGMVKTPHFAGYGDTCSNLTLTSYRRGSGLSWKRRRVVGTHTRVAVNRPTSVQPGHLRPRRVPSESGSPPLRHEDAFPAHQGFLFQRDETLRPLPTGLKRCLCHTFSFDTLLGQ